MKASPSMRSCCCLSEEVPWATAQVCRVLVVLLLHGSMRCASYLVAPCSIVCPVLWLAISKNAAPLSCKCEHGLACSRSTSRTIERRFRQKAFVHQTASPRSCSDTCSKKCYKSQAASDSDSRGRHGFPSDSPMPIPCPSNGSNQPLFVDADRFGLGLRLSRRTRG